MSSTIEKLEAFTETARTTLEKLGATNPGAADKAKKIENFQEHSLAQALAHCDQYTNAHASTISGPGGSRSSGSSSPEQPK